VGKRGFAAGRGGSGKPSLLNVNVRHLLLRPYDPAPLFVCICGMESGDARGAGEREEAEAAAVAAAAVAAAVRLLRRYPTLVVFAPAFAACPFRFFYFSAPPSLLPDAPALCVDRRMGARSFVKFYDASLSSSLFLSPPPPPTAPASPLSADRVVSIMLYPLPDRAAVLFYEFRFNYWLVRLRHTLRRVRAIAGASGGCRVAKRLCTLI